MHNNVLNQPHWQQSRFLRSSRTILTMAILTLSTAACMSTAPKMGASDGHTVTGGAGGASASGNNTGLERCDETLGTLSVYEDTNLTWWQEYRHRYPKLGSTLPVIRLMIQQSNCFVVVERGKAMSAMNRERELMQSGQLRDGSNYGGGQMVAADYTLSPEIQFSAENTEGIKAIGGALLGRIGSLVGGGVNKNEAATTLLLVDNRSGVQVSAAVGNAGNYDFNLFGGLFGGGIAGGASGYTNTPEGKVISAAFADSYNQMVRALRQYKAQEVKGGLGKGGRLSVGGVDDQPPQANNKAKIVPVAQTKVVVAPAPVVHKTRKKSVEFQIDDYDERALEKYYDALKNASTWASGLASYSATTTDTRVRDSLVAAMGIFTSQLESNRIELEAWPLDAKKAAWQALGKRIEKHNELFNKHRDMALNNKLIDEEVLNLLRGIALITHDSLFNS